MIGFKTEVLALEAVDQAVRAVENSGKAFIFKREARVTGLSWLATIAVKTKISKSFETIGAIKEASLNNEIDLVFSGSEMNIQNGDFETDYIFVTVEIRPK